MARPIFVFLLAVATATALAQMQNDGGAAASNAAASGNSGAIKITISTSRAQMQAGDNFLITAEIENVSKEVVYFNPRAFTLTAPPEIDPESPRDWYAVFPGPASGPLKASVGGHELKCEVKETGTDPTFDKVVVLPPGGRIPAYWSGKMRPTDSPDLKTLSWTTYALRVTADSIGRALSFPPGRYKIVVFAAYWNTYEGARCKLAEHQSDIAEYELSVAASQATILWGASIGAVIAFFLLPALKLSPEMKGTVHKAHGLITSVLLSVILTIMLSRLADTQFLVKVSVSDFWGAVVIGFVSSATGARILRMILQRQEAREAERRDAAQDGEDETEQPAAEAVEQDTPAAHAAKAGAGGATMQTAVTPAQSAPAPNSSPSGNPLEQSVASAKAMIPIATRLVRDGVVIEQHPIGAEPAPQAQSDQVQTPDPDRAPALNETKPRKTPANGTGD
jgi:hypothetical protein